MVAAVTAHESPIPPGKGSHRGRSGRSAAGNGFPALFPAVALFVALAALSLAEPETPESKQYLCRRATARLVIDGKLDEAAWRKAEVIQDWCFPWDKDGPKQAAKAYLLWDDEALYFGAWVEDSELLGDVTTTDEHQVWHDERFEFYVDPNPADDVYFCWEFTTMKHKLDYASSWGRRFFFGWDCAGLEYVVRVEGTLNDEQPDKGYGIEARVPFRPNFEQAVEFPPRKAKEGAEPAKQPKFERVPNLPPKPGDVWRLGVNREDQYRREGQKRMALSLWCDPKVAKPDFHVPSAFGRLVFAE